MRNNKGRKILLREGKGDAMNRIFLSGDTHGELDLDKVPQFFDDLLCYDMVDRNDYLIILGDAGILWDDGAQDQYVQQTLRDLPVTTLWLDGNHENFDLIDQYPEDVWHGGRVQFIDEHIIHLMRGQVYDIGGKTFFVFGGGNSIDKGSRTPRVSWWPEEMPGYEEYEEGHRNLEKVGNRVDYILTHTCPESIAHQLVTYLYSGEEQLQRYLDVIAESTEYEEWYFGHWHLDDDLGRFHCLYDRVFELEYE